MRAHAAALGVELQVRRFTSTTRTAEDAARQVGTDVGRIVKSLVFAAETGAGAGAAAREATPVVALCPGDARVDERLLAAALGAREIRRATAEEAKDFTGYAIGGVPPFAHARPCRLVADDGLLRFDLVWAAAGLPDAVFPIAPQELVRLSGAVVAPIAQRSSSSSADSSSPSYSSE